MYARVPHAMEQFFSKITAFSQIIATALILELSGAHGLPSRLWILVSDKFIRQKRKKVTMILLNQSLEDGREGGVGKIRF